MKKADGSLYSKPFDLTAQGVLVNAKFPGGCHFFPFVFSKRLLNRIQGFDGLQQLPWHLL